MNVWIFGIECALLLFGTVMWAWWAYDNDKLAPAAILLASMCETVFIVGVLVYTCVVTFGG